MERRQTAAEIVQRELAAAAPERRHQFDGLPQILNGGGFGDLETHSFGREGVGGELGFDKVEQSLVAEGIAGQVDGDPGAGLADTVGVLAKRRLNHPAVDGAHHAVAFGGRNEGGGQHQFTVLVLMAFMHHAQQHFIARRATVGPTQGNDGLIMQSKSLLFQSVAQAGRAQDFAVVSHRFGIFPLIEVHTIAAQLLGDITGDVGLSEQLGGVLRLRRDRYQADADPDLVSQALPVEAVVVDGAHHGLGDTLGTFQRTVVQQQAELIAANACQRIAPAEHAGQDDIDLSEQFVARRMTGGVVDDLELIQVQIA